MKDEPERADKDVVLVVDLDGALCRTDTLHEAALDLATRRPGALLRLGLDARGGAGSFRAALARRHVLPARSLPLDDRVLDLVRHARRQGRRTALVASAHERQARAVAEAVGLFDDVVGPGDGPALSGAAKAARLTERYGVRGFDHVGAGRADIPVWAAAREAVTVGADRALARQAAAANPRIRHLAPPEGRGGAVLRAMRPRTPRPSERRSSPSSPSVSPPRRPMS